MAQFPLYKLVHLGVCVRRQIILPLVHTKDVREFSVVGSLEFLKHVGRKGYINIAAEHSMMNYALARPVN